MYSSACLNLFDEPPAGRPIAEVLGIEVSARSRFQTAVDLAYSDDCTMPFDEIMAMAKAPRRIEQAGDRNIDVYSVHLRTRKSSGDMMRKLSVTLSHNMCHLLGTSFRKKPSTASQKPL
jgi:hypothetical protein